MARTVVKEVDHGWRAIKAEVNALNKIYIKTGIQSDAPDHKAAEGGETPMVLIAAANEFGTHDGHIPERSFIRSAFDENRETYFSAIKRGLAKLMGMGEGARGQGIILAHTIGIRAENDIKKKINSDIPPPNAPETVRRKGSDRTLLDTAQMRESVRHVVGSGEDSDV